MLQGMEKIKEFVEKRDYRNAHLLLGALIRDQEGMEYCYEDFTENPLNNWKDGQRLFVLCQVICVAVQDEIPDVEISTFLTQDGKELKEDYKHVGLDASEFCIILTSKGLDILEPYKAASRFAKCGWDFDSDSLGSILGLYIAKEHLDLCKILIQQRNI